MLGTTVYLAGLVVAAGAQEIFLTTTGNSARPQYTQAAATPSYYFQPFSYTLNETVR